MTDIYRKLSDTKFVDYNIGGYHVLAPDFLADKHARSSWEVARFRSMEQELKPGNILIDVGAEQGQMSAIYAKFVGGGENMVLIEPTPQCWPNIKATWEANGLRTPMFNYCGFASDKSVTAGYHDFEIGYAERWPNCAYSEYLLDATKFRYITEHSCSTDSTTLDEFISHRKGHGLIPSAITIDVEGFEICVLRGAVETIREHSPLLWVSLHTEDNDVYARDVPGDHVGEVHSLMSELDYVGTELGVDHEQHWLFRKR